ncbi:31384_t:CDS:2, partial [Racocetra persica]
YNRQLISCHHHIDPNSTRIDRSLNIEENANANGELQKNVIAWLLQVQSIFHAQEIDGDDIQIYYVATEFEGAALHWYLNKVTAAGNDAAFDTWNDFATALKKLYQTGFVQDYGTQFHNIIEQIEDMDKNDKVTYFIEGFKYATWMKVIYQAPANLNEAWDLAIQFDTTMFGTGRPSTTTPNKPQQYINKLGKGNGRPVPMELNYARSSSSSQHHRKKRSKGKQKLTNIKDELNQPPHTITNNSLELTQVEENHEWLLKFNSKINGYSVWILLDSRASRNFIDKDFSTWNKLILKTVFPLSVKLADRSKAQTDKTFNINKLELDPYYTSGISTQVLKLQHYDTILEKP